MNSSTAIPDDLLLIMQSYVDPPPQAPHGASASRPKQAPVSVRATEATEATEATDGWSEGEDEVESAIQVESSDDESPKHSVAFEPIPKVVLIATKGNTADDDSSSDSDSSDSDSDVEMRVTKYPTRAKQLASLTALIKPTDSDAEDEDDAVAGSSKQYAGTKNEILVPEVEVPDITEVPSHDVLEQIGEIMTIIDSVVVVKGNTTGVHRVLDTDSLLVFDDRKVLGKVFETFGAVKQPLYSVRFPSAAVIDKNAFWIGRAVCHVPTRSNFVFTEAIARIKGSDASNLHDEEIAEDQMDFSDDEAEAQWRRNRKEARREQASSSSHNQKPERDTTPKPKPELTTSLPYPAADDGDVPYSALPYDDAPDPRPAPAAYDPYSDHEGEPKPPPPPTPRSNPPSPQNSRNGSEPGGSRGRGRERGRGRGAGNPNRRERKNTGPSERGRPNRGRGDRGRGDRGRGGGGGGRGRGRGMGGGGGGDRRPGHSGGFVSDQHNQPQLDQYHDLSPTSFAIAHATGQYSQDYLPHHDEGYSPNNAGNGFYDEGSMPHINPRFFSGEMSGDMNAGFGLPWGDVNNVPGYGYGYPQSGYGYGGYGQGDESNYNQGYGTPSYWHPEEQSYPPYPHNQSRERRGSRNDP